MQKYPSTMIANCFIHLHKQDHANKMFPPKMDYMSVSKLCYLAYAWSLALNDDHFFEDRPIAGEFGPIFENIIFAMHKEQNDGLRTGIKHYHPASNTWTMLLPSKDDRDCWNIIDQIWDRYKTFSPTQLSTLSHEPGSPWEKARNANMREMDIDAIKAFYRAKLKNPTVQNPTHEP